MKNHFFIALKVSGVLTILLGLIYPLAITLFAQTVFPQKANGSLIVREGRIIGSHLLAQKFLSQGYFWARPSASDYGAVPSGASNQGPTSKVLKAALEERKAKGMTLDLLFASGSGLDPHISIDAALSQVGRIVQSRNLSESDKSKIVELIQQNTERRDFGLFGEPRVNVLLLNLGMDKISVN